MTEYKTVCSIMSGDTMTASADEGGVQLVARHNGRFATDVCLTPEKTREFARALLALADEADGGEVDAIALKVGDRLRVTQGFLEYADVDAGDTVTVVEAPEGGGIFKAADDNGRRWTFGLDNIGNGLERVEGDPELRVHADDSAAQGVKVGDRVVIVREWETGTSQDDGEAGTVVQLDPKDDAFPYCVQPYSAPFRTVWVHEVQRERTAATAADASAPSIAPERAAYIEEAWKLAGECAEPADVLKYARFLACEQ